MRGPLPILAVASALSIAAPDAAGDRGRRRPPADDPHPHVVTQRFLLKLAAGTWRLDDYVDADAGVVYLDVEEGLGPPRRGAAELACGPAIARRLKRARRELYAKLLGDYATGGLRCHNRPGPPGCTAGGTTEGDGEISLVFRDDPARGLRLTAIVFDDDHAHAEPDERARADAARTRAIADLAAPGCPAPAP